MILLDTDHLTVLKYPDTPRYEALYTRLEAAEDEDIGTTVVSLEEQLRGWLAIIAKHKQVKRQVAAYHELIDVVDFFGRWTILPFDEPAANEFERLRHDKVRVGTMDLKIASIVLANHGLLLSANLRDFTKVPGLQVENWLTAQN